MSGNSTSGIRGSGSNTYYFPPYDGRQYDLPEAKSTAIYPSVVTDRKTYRARNQTGTKYDVRSSYSNSHSLRQTPPQPASVPSSSNLSDLFIRAHLPEDDKALLKMQEEARESRKDAKSEMRRWLTRIHISSSDCEDRWRVSKPVVKKARKRSVVEKKEKKEGEKETCPHVCHECGTKKKKRKARKSPAQRFVEVLSRYSLLIVCCVALALIPTAVAKSATTTAFELDDSLYDFLFRDPYPQLPPDPSPSFSIVDDLISLLPSSIPTPATIFTTILLTFLLFSTLCSLILASIYPLRQSVPSAIVCAYFLYYNTNEWSFLIVSFILVGMLQSPSTRMGITIIKETCIETVETVCRCGFWRDLWNAVKGLVVGIFDLCVCAAVVVSQTTRWCLHMVKMYGGLLLMCILDAVNEILLKMKRKMESKTFWLSVAVAVVVGNWVMLQVVEMVWRHNLVVTRASPEKFGRISVS